MNPIFEEYQDIIPDYPLFLESLHHPLPTHFRVNRLKTEPSSVVRLFREKGVPVVKNDGPCEDFYIAPVLDSVGTSMAYYGGHIHPQAYTSCMAALALGPSKHAYVLDMCAAPGGKTAHIAQLMGNTGLIVANELYSTRQVILGHTLSRLGVFNAVFTAYQAQQFPLQRKFDFILVDVPCSGEGMFRRLKETDVYHVKKKKEKLPDLQKKILRRGFDLLTEKGVMLYATCTYNPEENEAIVNDLLRHRDAALFSINIGISYEQGLTAWRHEQYDEQIRRCARFYPHRTDSVGFFMARIGRRQ